jgi:cell fate regulator YaaT (PSP1 superfamily)
VVAHDAGDLLVRRGEKVVVETERGLSLAWVVTSPVCQAVRGPLPRILRLASADDLRQADRNRRREEEALRYCWERIRAHGLPMKLIRVEYLHGGNKAVFYFSADGRIDFRELVKDLAYRLHTRVEMRQIGVRDASKMVGGVGICGRELCCSSWLQKFEPVSIRMAKVQNLSLNPEKVSGVCGRLMCCLAYEQETYQALRKRLPRVGKHVVTPRGEGRVTEIDILAQRVRVTFADGAVVELDAAQVQVQAPGAEEEAGDVPEELRGLEDAPEGEGRGRLPAEGREVQAARGTRRKPWQDGRAPGGSFGERPPENWRPQDRSGVPPRRKAPR